MALDPREYSLNWRSTTWLSRSTRRRNKVLWEYTKEKAPSQSNPPEQSLIVLQPHMHQRLRKCYRKVGIEMSEPQYSTVSLSLSFFLSFNSLSQQYIYIYKYMYIITSIYISLYLSLFTQSPILFQDFTSLFLSLPLTSSIWLILFILKNLVPISKEYISFLEIS